jgi:hypothetical protein
VLITHVYCFNWFIFLFKVSHFHIPLTFCSTKRGKVWYLWSKIPGASIYLELRCSSGHGSYRTLGNTGETCKSSLPRTLLLSSVQRLFREMEVDIRTWVRLTRQHHMWTHSWPCCPQYVLETVPTACGFGETCRWETPFCYELCGQCPCVSLLVIYLCFQNDEYQCGTYSTSGRAFPRWPFVPESIVHNLITLLIWIFKPECTIPT